VRVLGVSGSLRGGSHNTRLLRAAAALLPADAELVEFGAHALKARRSSSARIPPSSWTRRGLTHRTGAPMARRTDVWHRRGMKIAFVLYPDFHRARALRSARQGDPEREGRATASNGTSMSR